MDLFEPPMLRAAVIGTGAIARQHLSCLRSLPGAEIVAVCDVSAATAAACAERYGVSRWYADLGRLLDEAQPDVVHVTTPPQTHASIAVAAVQAGANVIVEKPAVVEERDWFDLRRRAEAAGRWVVADHNYCFDPRVLAVEAEIRNGTFGTVSAVDVGFAQAIARADHAFADRSTRHPALDLPGGPIFDFLPHLASLALAFVGEPERVEAWWRPADPALALPYDRFTALVAGSGAVATVSFDATAEPEGFWMAIQGTKAQARLNLYEGRLTVTRAWPSLPSPLRPLANAGTEARAALSAATRSFGAKLLGRLVSYDGLRRLLADTYAAAAAGQPPPVTHDDIEAVIRLVERFTAPTRSLVR